MAEKRVTRRFISSIPPHLLNGTRRPGRRLERRALWGRVTVRGGDCATLTGVSPEPFGHRQADDEPEPKPEASSPSAPADVVQKTAVLGPHAAVVRADVVVDVAIGDREIRA